MHRAFRLKPAGYDVLLEAGHQVGGRMRTTERDGFRFDVGAGILIRNYTEMLRLIADAGLSSEIILDTNDLMGFFRDGEIYSIPNHSVTSPLRSPYLSWKAKLRSSVLGIDVLRGGRRLSWTDPEALSELDHETTREYGNRRVRNREVFDYGIDPVSAATSFMPPDTVAVVDSLAYMRKVFGHRFFNSPHGVQFLPNGLIRDIPVETRARVTNVEERPDEVLTTWAREGEPDHTETAAACVVALRAPELAEVFPPLDADRREILESIEYPHGSVISLGLSAQPKDNSAALVFPECESPHLLGGTLDHNKVPGRARPEKGLATFWWRQPWSEKYWGESDSDIASAVLPEVDRVFPGIESDVEFVDIHRWDKMLMAHPPRAATPRSPASGARQPAPAGFSSPATG